MIINRFNVILTQLFYIVLLKFKIHIKIKNIIFLLIVFCIELFVMLFNWLELIGSLWNFFLTLKSIINFSFALFLYIIFLMILIIFSLFLSFNDLHLSYSYFYYMARSKKISLNYIYYKLKLCKIRYNFWKIICLNFNILLVLSWMPKILHILT